MRGGPLGQRLLRLERRYEAEGRELSRSGRRSRVPQPDLVLLLDWVREKANPNARAANGHSAAHSLSSTTNEDTHAGTLSCTAHDDSYLDAHLGGYEHSHNAALSGATHRHHPCLTATDGQRING